MSAAPAPERVVRPAVWVNCAASADGRIAYAGRRRALLSSPEDLRRVQQLRANADGILIGVGTVVADDPSLRVHWDLLGQPPGRSPTRIVVDSVGRTPATARVLDGSVPTIVAVAERCQRTFPAPIQMVVAGVERVDLAALLVRLHELGLRRLMIEGGAEILASVLREGLFDRWTIYYAPRVIGGTSAPSVAEGPDAEPPETMVGLRLVGLDRVGEGHVATYVPAGASVMPDRGSPPPEARP
ncbi:MAG TPA: dihydrofolate reductase family protein [Thermoplasmata archaeon]|nr:dihydrofolate reductase family protein [Thermoplasmata archaeon]